MMTFKRQRVTDETSSDDESRLEKEIEPFSVTAFRKGLHGPNGFTALKNFVRLSHSSHDVPSQYLEGGGGALELLQMLSGEARTTSQYETMFSALQVLIMRTLTHSPRHQPSMEEACRHLINSHLKAIHSLLSVSSKPRHKKSVLRLLTAMVSLSVGIARDVLSHVTFSLPIVEVLTKQAEPHARQSVRTCFIHFLMAFLVDGDMATIRPLLDKKGLLGSIMREMVYDRMDLVILVLTTLRTKLLENTGVSKTIKLHTFNTQVVQSLLALYHWQGPAAWKRPTKKKRKREFVVEVLEEEHEAVAEVVHQLLLVLCSSHKYGVAFHDHSLGTTRVRHNELLHSVLLTIQHPWEQEKPTELVVRMLAACPDLVRGVMVSVEPFLEPRASQRWLQAVSFVEQVVQALDPELYLRTCTIHLAPHQLLSSVLALTVPVAAVRSIGPDALLHPHATVRHRAALLLKSLLTRLRDAVTCLDNLQLPEIQQLKPKITAYLIKHLPGGSLICEAWKKTFEPQDTTELSEETLDIPSLSVCLSTLLDLLLLYHQCCPHLMDFNLDLHSFLYNVRDLQDACLHVKMYQLLLTMDSLAFTPDKELFKEALILLLGAMCDPSLDVGSLAKTAVMELLLGSRLFDSARGELPVWLHCYKSVPAEHRDAVGLFLASVVAKVAQNPSVSADDSEQEDEPLPNKWHGDEVFEELMEARDYRDVDKNCRPYSSVELSPLLPGALEQAAVQSGPAEVHYLSCVVIHLLHNQITPDNLLHLVGHWPNLLPTPVCLYLQGWSSQGSPAPLQKPFGVHSPESRLSRVLLRPKDGSVYKALALEDGHDLDLKGVPDMDLDHLLLLVKLSVFYLSRLASSGKLSEDVCDRSREALMCLLNVMQKADVGNAHDVFMGESFKAALTHPLLLRYFSPLFKKKHASERLVTKLLLDLLKLASELLDGTIMGNLSAPFRQRLLDSISRGIRRASTDLEDEGVLMSAVELLHLGQEDITELLGLVVSIPAGSLVRSGALSPWGELLTYLLRHSGVQSAKTVAATASCLMELDSCEGLALLEDGLYCYLLRFPHSLAYVPLNLFETLLHRLSAAHLSALMIERNSALVPAFMVHVLKKDGLLTRPKVFLPLLLAALSHGEDRAVLDATCAQYWPDIELALLKPHQTPDWIQPNTTVLKTLVAKSLDMGTCKKICGKISKKDSRLDKCKNFHLDLIVSIYVKAGLSPTQVLLTQLAKALRHTPVDKNRARHLCQLLSGCLNNVPVVNHAVMQELLMLTLKSGMCMQMTIDRVPLLDLITRVLGTVYSASEWESPPEAGLVYEMVLSHSEFLNIMLGEDKDTKRELVQLLLVLAKHDMSVLQSDHAPILLGAYGATLATTDQLILQLLRQYEVSGVNLHMVRPYLWGEVAVSHYSVRSPAGLALWRLPHTSQVLELLDMSRVERTLASFPVHRQLEVLNDYHNTQDDLIDPAFFLPLFSHLLAPEALVHPHVFTQKGALALTLATLGSHCSDVRAAGGHVLARYQFHLEAGRISKETQLVLQFLNAVRGGVADLSDGAALPPQTSCVAATFLARASLVMSRPLHPLYTPLHTYLLARPALKLNVVPEFLVLLHGDHVDFSLCRHWIVEVLRDGLRTEHDADVYLRSHVFKLLLSLYSSVLCDRATKVLVLQTLEAALQLPAVAPRLVSSHGLIPWLHKAVELLNPVDTELVSAMLSALATLPSVASRDCLLLLLALLPKIPCALPLASLCRYLHALADTQTEGEILQVHQLQSLLCMAGNILDSTGDCEGLLLYGCQFAAAAAALPAWNLMSKEDQAKTLLRQIILMSLRHADKVESAALELVT